MATGARTDPFGHFNFLGRDRRDRRARLPGGDRLRLDDRRDRAPRGRENTTTRKLPGLTKYSNIIAASGAITDDRQLYEWHRRRVDGQVRAPERLARSARSARQEVIALELLSMPGPPSATAPTSTPRATTSRSRRSSSPTKVCERVEVTCFRPNTSSRCRSASSTSDGTLHRDGMMRLATAADEILPLKDPASRRRTRPTWS